MGFQDDTGMAGPYFCIPRIESKGQVIISTRETSRACRQDTAPVLTYRPRSPGNLST